MAASGSPTLIPYTSEVSGMAKCKVIESYTSAYPNPLKLRRGDEVAVTEKECEWPGWLWCADTDGVQGWVPTSYLDRAGGTARLLRDYDATELSVSVDDELEIIEEESGWFRCRKPSGEIGWVPENVVASMQT
jgi:SH3-like domain-containing protein